MLVATGRRLKADTREFRRELVYRKLKDDLVNCRFQPGQHLSITLLSAKMRVSNTPVREALIRLAGERLVSMNPTHGFFASTPRIREMRELINLAECVLLFSIDKGEKPFPNDQVWRPLALSLQSERRAMRALRRNPDDTVSMMHSLFLAIASMSANQAVIDLVRNICDRTRQICIWEAQQHRHADSLASQLVELLTAMEAGNGEKGRSLIANCLQRLSEGVAESLPKGLASLLVNGES